MRTTNESRIRRAAIRVAARTTDPKLKRQLLDILKGAACETKACGEVTGRYEEGKPADPAKDLREMGLDDAADEWEGNTKKYKDKFKAASASFPSVHKAAWHEVLSYCQSHPRSKLARTSTSVRRAAADRLTHRWVVAALAERRTAKYAKASKRQITAALETHGRKSNQYPLLVVARELSQE